MYAIIRSGGKQYRVAQGETLLVERDVLSNADQEKVTFNEVLMVGGDQPKVGIPMVLTFLRRGEKRTISVIAEES